jgi:tyrosinase
MASTLGFGGDGSSLRTEVTPDDRTIHCVDDGPFKDLRPARVGISPTDMRNQEHCLFRHLTDGNNPDAAIMAQYYNSTSVEIVQGEKKFLTYHTALEGGPHGTIHASLGGEMNPTTSPNGKYRLLHNKARALLTSTEPLFFLHHAQIDRLWWLWQEEDIENRASDYSGTIHNKDGSYTDNGVSLDDILQMMGIEGDLTVRDVMNTTNSRLCYTY